MRINRRITAILVFLTVGMFQANSAVSAQTVARVQYGQRPSVYGPGQEDMEQEPPVVAMTDDLQFYPNQIVVSVGTTVVWQNVSGTIHTVTDTPGAQAYMADALLPSGALPFDSGNIAPGQSYAYTFSVPGTYTYYCRHHEGAGMVGQITVVPR